MSYQKINSIGIVGCGAMGLGIAELFLTNRYEVTLIDSQLERLDSGLKFLQHRMDKFAESHQLTVQELYKLKSNILFTYDYKVLNERNVKFIIEAVFEDENVKTEVFKMLAKNVDRDVILASNTSSLSIEKLANNLNFSDRFLGVHFFNPVKHMPLVELVPHQQTDMLVLETVKNLMNHIGKVSVVCKDSPGFIVNKLLIPMINQAGLMLDHNLASPQDIDKAMTMGAKMPMGPLRLADFIGLDIVVAIQNVFFDVEKNAIYKPAQTFLDLVASGYLGIKTKKGIYEYD